MPFELNFGRIPVAKSGAGAGPSGKFRLLVLGDFSARAQRGELGRGADLAKRKPIRIDVDNFDQILQRQGIRLALPIAGGTVEVPMRIAVVQDGVTPKPIVSTFGKEAVTIGGDVDRANFTHVDDTISFPLPRPLGLLDSYVVYVGFDPIGAKPPERKKPVVKRRAKPAAKPR